MNGVRPGVTLIEITSRWFPVESPVFENPVSMKTFMSTPPETHTIIAGDFVTLLVDTAVKNRTIKDFRTECSEFFRFPPQSSHLEAAPLAWVSVVVD
jgi:hypothetical protein